ncbi:kinesin-like protein [Rhodotorula toruloides]
MSTTQFGGPGSAFSFAAPTRPSRRANSSSSFKDAAASSPTANGTSSHSSGPAPVDPPAAPSLGSFSPSHERENTLSPNGTSGADAGSARSFSSILSPSLSATANGGALGEANGASGKGKPFVYTREFLLSLYDEEKAKKRPLELAAHETATRELTGSSDGAHKPWLLQEYREGEKELFATSIHPANNRPSRMNRTDSSLSTGGANGSSSTLDLSTLGTLPRDRDRALGSPSIRSPSVEKEGLLGSAGRERRTRERSSGATMGIMGGVLGGIAANTPTRKREESSGSATKEGVWQGGRWRRNAQEAEEAEKQRSSAFGSRRFPLADDESRRSSLSTGAAEPVAESWEDSTPPDDGEKRQQGSSALNGTSLNEANEPDVTASVLGSLALDSDPVDDPLLRKPSDGTGTPSRVAPPPGLGSLPPVDVMWQYRDPSGQVQGPFSATMMHDWYRQQFFTPDLRVKRTTDADFESLENLVRRTGDSEKPFLAPSPRAIGTASAFSSAPGTPRPGSAWGSTPVGRAQTPLEQLTSAVSQGRFAAGAASASSPFYEPFGSASASPAPQAQTLQQSFSQSPAPQADVDPWGAPLPLPSAPGSSWNGAAQQQQPQTPNAHVPLQSPMGILRQLALQQHGLPGQQQAFGQHGHPLDAFGRPSPLPATPFFDPSNLAAASPTAWIGQQLPQQHTQQAQHPWASLTGANAPTDAIGSPFAQFAQSPAAAPSVPEPIGTPSAQASATQPSAAQLSPWGDVQQQQPPAPVVEVKETVIVAESETPAAPAIVAVVEEVEVEVPVPKQTETEARKIKAAAKASSPVAAPQQVAPPVAPEAESSPSPAPSASSKAAAAAPWAKEDVVAAVPANPSPSLREIQEAEAREAAKRKEAARIHAAQANIQAAQRAAALEAQAAAESLPPSASWAAGPAQVPAPKPTTSSPAATASASAAAPWSKPAAAPVVAVAKGQKTLKEIQEEEERQKKAKLAAQQQQQAVAGLVGRGYAGSVAQAALASNSPWITVAAKPTVARPSAPAAKPIVPGLPGSSTSVTAARTPGSTGLPVKPASPAPAAVRPAAPAASASVKIVAPRSINVASPSTAVYDMENPPPPSPEFLSWTKQALKGLNVPLEEFVQMLLSFPLEASADVLEIISDSVYANSSTLDGRRFANDFTTRRKNDVAVRYPSIFAKGAVRTAAGKPSSMAAVLASAPAQPQQEWNVKVSAKKKKGGK